VLTAPSKKAARLSGYCGSDLMLGGPASFRRLERMAASHVRREKAALSSGCKPRPANRSSRKQLGQPWRRRNV